MPKSVVVVHNDTAFTDRITGWLRASGHDVVVFSDPMAALDALEAGLSADLLVTRVQFPAGKPNGLALARMLRVKRPGIKVLITGKADLAKLAAGLGEFHPHPVDIRRMMETVERMLDDSAEPVGQTAA